MTSAQRARRSTRARPTARAVAFDVLRRIERDGAFANLVLGPALERSSLDERDRRFVTDLVYGTTRMRRACDSLVDRFASSEPDPPTRTLLRLGAYQLAFADVPPHAAVAETVGLAPRKTRGFVNAVLRRVAEVDLATASWPSEAARLSYPEWIVERLVSELGDEAIPALERMNEPPPVTERADGYVQDLSSQWVAAAVEARPTERLLDLCAAPGGKATALARTGADVVANDRRGSRTSLVVDNARRLGLDVAALVSDGVAAPFADATFDAVLVDAPCSGLGALRRRPDARWRVEASDVDQLVDLQRRLLDESARLVRPGGRLVWSVCTVTAAESTDHPAPVGFEVDRSTPPDGSWRPTGDGWRVLPHDADTDGMTIVRYRRR
ncbi:MAG: transcription antitermination factor NusB [Actinomycetota bacterium]